ncbi:MAG: hypothetical protein PHW77_08990 [Eubacteriales bacterium]|nr:hypothetical protein [Eubacteriales bacterium]
MAVTVTPMRTASANTGYSPIAATGASEITGTPENFEFTFPSKDETIYIIVTNGAVATVTAKLAANSPNNGFTPPTLSLAVGKVGVFRIESGFVKAANGKITLTVTPNAASTVAASGVNVYGIYSGVITR